MRTTLAISTLLLAALTACQSNNQPTIPAAAPDSHSTPAVPARVESPTAPDHRMDWWRDARFGMFIHWGLYSIPAGDWKDHKNYGEWIRTEGQIPVTEYEKLKDQFNPVKFDADAWVSLAKAAGMKYIVITTKHHDGFCLFDSKETDWDVMSTPFHRDIMKEMSEACRKQGIQICWYHSIMDWHHPDYLPRRGWEKDRPTQGADFNRFNQYLKNQVAELLTNYGPIGVLWFDGQWEGTWTHERGQDLAAHVRKLQPNIIINNRVDKGGGQFGMTKSKEYAGDFGTPEQEIPPTGFPGVDWETCMTMNNHWGYNKNDHNFKSSEDLIRKLADIASKGGNFLLNVGPTSLGEIPPESVDRLHDLAKWMEVNGESIHGTQAGPFEKLEWGRCTMRQTEFTLGSGTSSQDIHRLYLHIFNWPKDRRLVIPGLFNEPLQAKLLADKTQAPLPTERRGPDVVVLLPTEPLDKSDTVLALDIAGTPDVSAAPQILSEADIFVDEAVFSLTSKQEHVQVRYTLDGSDPTPKSPSPRDRVTINKTTTIAAQSFRGDRAISPIAHRTLTKVEPLPPVQATATKPGVHFQYFEGDWSKVPDFSKMKPALEGHATAFDRKPRNHEDHFGFRYTGYVNITKPAAYTFWTDSDDGSNLYIDDKLAVNNDGLHSLESKSGTIPLAAGLHSFRLDFFEKGGGHELTVEYAAPGMPKKPLPASDLLTDK
jgi:alpha-L-fucosidase